MPRPVMLVCLGIAATMVLVPRDGATAPRWLIAGRADATTVNVTTNLWLGYGTPHGTKLALELVPKLSSGSVSLATGVLGSLGGLQLRLHGRYLVSLTRALLAPASSYGTVAAESRAGPRLRYAAIDTEAKLERWAGVGFVRLEATVSWVQATHPGYLFWEDGVRAVVGEGFVWTAEAGYLFAQAQGTGWRLGPTVEVVGLPGRQAGSAGRAGLLFRWLVTPAWEARGEWLLPIWGPDKIGAQGGRPFALGVRWKWH